MVLYCDSSECVNCKDHTCQLATLTLFDGQCEEYESIFEGQEYQEQYFVACKYSGPLTDNPVRYRAERKGKRFEYGGLTFYTNSDIRYSIEGAGFTEAVTGFLVGGKDILNDEAFVRIKEIIKNETPVLSLPWMDYDYKSAPTPHKEQQDHQPV